MNTWFSDLATIETAHTSGGEMWHEFLRVTDLSVGLYVIPAGAPDPQSPHHEDEVYLVLEGKGKFTADGSTVDVDEGSVLYVAREIDHRFHDIVEDLRVLVFFAPAHT